ncbi:thioesterase domain-containing protein [Micromonospora sp. NPDC047074]|uniref:thioesterase II family protein n=1 Tax=Micromonospora sp. NPDC047074 TaxID=3154339 RepID=UPI00340FB24C
MTAPAHDTDSSRAAAAGPGRWFAPGRPAATADVLLFCLPFAGGGAAVYRRWAGPLWAGIAVEPVLLPGRESRVGEPPQFTVEQVTTALAERADRPYAIYGHSMGARLGFEVARELRRRALPPPLALYVAASRPPDVPAAASDLVGADVRDRVAALGTDLDGALEHPELRELLLPALRSDFAWVDAYRYHPQRPLDVPLIGLAGQDDPGVHPEGMRGWARHTTASFRLHTVAGGHLFLRTAREETARLVAGELRALAGMDGAW